MSKRDEEEKKNYEGHCALVDCLIGIVKRMWLLSYGWPRCTLDGQFFPSDTTFIYVYRHRIINVVFIFVVVSQCSLAMVSKLSCYNVFFRFISMWLCNHMNVFTYIHICEKRERVCVWAKACYFNHHYEQMFFGLLVIIFVSSHIYPDGWIAKRYVRE
jgi:hypothetical protein